MKKNLLMTGIFILGVVLILSSCGGTLGNSLIKVLAEAGAYAIEFPLNNPGWNYVSAPVKNAPLLRSPVTVEAWVKIDDPVSGGGSVIARGDRGTGVELSVNTTDGTTRFLASDPDEIPNFVEAAGTTNVMDGSWHHLAGVLTAGGHDHSGEVIPTIPAITCNAAAQGNIHVDVYVDGNWENCAGPFVHPEDSGTPSSIDICQQVSTGDYVGCTTNVGRDIYVVGTGILFVGVIDEVRVWGTERSAGQIDYWKNEEISGADWDTADPAMANIKGYWRFNQGTGGIATDSSGYGNNGTKFQCITPGFCNTNDEEFGPWLDGWVEGHQFLY